MKHEKVGMIVPVSVELLMTVTGFWQYENQKKSQSELFMVK